MRERDIQFTRDFVAAFPGLQPMLSEHLEDNFGEVLPHLFLADVLRWLVSQSASAEGDGAAEVLPVLSFLEDAFEAGDDERQELISTGFLENLPRADEGGSTIRDMLPPKLRDEAGRVA